MKSQKTFNILILFLVFISNAQTKKLIELRNMYCEEQCDFYHNHLDYLSKLPSWPPSPLEISHEKDTLMPFFKIPLEERKKLFPFSKYDSVYIVTPKYYDDKEPRNYIKSKFHDSKTLVTEEQMNKISDILFNYYEVIHNKFITRTYTITGRGIEETYPKIILLFVKNGKPKDYIVFPSQIFRRTSFSDKELEGLDLGAEKEKLIIEMFGVNLEEPYGEVIERDEDGILNEEYKEN
ncbi:hypothetical protein ACFFLS_10015 [Flavobacterium procerum]|uniref:Uncharacterized protein n=1 Tax=Flavobacterium procerum TaxID=1455569 RepID=A0ABV6BPJ2_9FLAO